MAEKDNFLIEWYKRLHFTLNPFEDEILHPIDDYLCGYVEEKKKLNLFVLEKQPFGMVQGEKGYGKTVLLKWLQEQLAPHDKKYTVWYLTTNDLKTEQDLIKTLTEPVLSGFSKLTHPEKKLTIEQLAPYLAKKIHPKTLFLLIDETHPLPPKYLGLFKHLYEGLNVQIILAGTKNELAEAHLINQKDTLKITLKGLTLEHAAQFIQKCIERAGGLGLHPFTKEHFQQLYEKSGRNPALLLKLCREKALQLSLDKQYLEQALQNLAEQKRAKKPKGFFHIRFMSDEDYAREQMIPETPLEAQFELHTPVEIAPEPEPKHLETPIETVKPAPKPNPPKVQELPQEIALDPFEEESEGFQLEEEKIQPKEVDATEVQYEFEENQPEETIIVEPEKQPNVVIEEHVNKGNPPKEKKGQKTKETHENDDLINDIAKEFMKG